MSFFIYKSILIIINIIVYYNISSDNLHFCPEYYVVYHSTKFQFSICKSSFSLLIYIYVLSVFPIFFLIKYFYILSFIIILYSKLFVSFYIFVYFCYFNYIFLFVSTFSSKIFFYFSYSLALLLHILQISNNQSFVKPSFSNRFFFQSITFS